MPCYNSAAESGKDPLNKIVNFTSNSYLTAKYRVYLKINHNNYELLYGNQMALTKYILLVQIKGVRLIMFLML